VCVYLSAFDWVCSYVSASVCVCAFENFPVSLCLPLRLRLRLRLHVRVRARVRLRSIRLGFQCIHESAREPECARARTLVCVCVCSKTPRYISQHNLVPCNVCEAPTSIDT